MDVLTGPVLVLNKHFTPIQLTTTRRAFVLLYSGIAQAIDEQGNSFDFDEWRKVDVRAKDDFLPIVGGQIRVPRIVQLHRYDRLPRSSIRLTRRNLMVRDEFQCQYCMRKPPVRDLNIDHVMPKSRGGNASWENLVTACRHCNLKKAWKTPEEANMRLNRIPRRPKWSTAVQILMTAGGQVFEEWDPFLKAS